MSAHEDVHAPTEWKEHLRVPRSKDLVRSETGEDFRAACAGASETAKAAPWRKVRAGCIKASP